MTANSARPFEVFYHNGIQEAAFDYTGHKGPRRKQKGLDSRKCAVLVVSHPRSHHSPA